MKKRTILWIVLSVVIVVGIILAVLWKNGHSGGNALVDEEITTVAALSEVSESESSSKTQTFSERSAHDDAVSFKVQDSALISTENNLTSNQQFSTTNGNHNSTVNTDNVSPEGEGTEKTVAGTGIQTTAAVPSDADLPTLIVDSVDTTPGSDDIEVNVRIVNNPGVLATSFILHYDDSLLELKKAENGEAFASLNYTPPKHLSDGCVFTWYGETLEKDDLEDGVLLSMHFSVSKSTRKGSYPIEITGFDGNTYNLELEELNLTNKNGYINVK